jgi:UDP-N-acetylmuramate: L-alanyl-gamma-D-glutamyl-meso-diaminopimelate ligase
MAWTQVVRVGQEEANDLRIVDFVESAAGARFSLRWRGQLWANVQWAQSGLFNARNAAMAAAAAGLALQPDRPTALSLAALATFRGVRRRQEVRLTTARTTVIEDFGHHPTALAETLQSFRARYPGALLTAVFEARSNTARIKAMQAGFMRALAQADEVYLGAVNRADKIPAAERFDPEAVAQQLEAQGIDAHFAVTNAALLEKLIGLTLQPAAAAVGRPRVVVFFTNGSFDGIIDGYVAAAK